MYKYYLIEAFKNNNIFLNKKYQSFYLFVNVTFNLSLTKECHICKKNKLKSGTFSF
jgi:hypothetical protein